MRSLLFILLTSLLTVALLSSCSTVTGLFGGQERVTFYTTYGYLDENEWVIPMRIYVHEDRRNVERVVTRVARDTRNRTPQEMANFRSRIRDFVADSESRERVQLRFEGDNPGAPYQLRDESGPPLRTGLNGFKTGEIRLSAEEAEKLLEEQNSEDGWLTFNAVSDGHQGTGRVRLVQPEGISVISDVDDTVKITEIPAGSRVVVHNTFFKGYEAAPGMADLYSEWEGASFHYVSGSPWQLFRPISSFLFDEPAGYPEGSFHMKTVRKNPLSVNTWRDLRTLITDETLTYRQKISQISRIMEHFPDRQFILVGDSGERDPEVYRTIQQRFPEQVKRILIRDVINDRELNPRRLDGMEIIPVPTIIRQDA